MPTVIPSLRSLVLGALVATVVAGCYTTDPYTGGREMNKTSKGAIIGAASGAVIGLITGDSSRERRERALIGAGVGGLAGAGIGAYMDRQEAKLREQLRGTGVSVTRVGDNITLNMPGNITFRTDSADLNASFFGVLDSVALVAKEYDKTLIEAAGHTDSTGSEQYNQQLSERRAATVADYLRSRGIRADRLITVGAGESRPIASNETAEGRAQNRRVELTFAPIRAK
ncbi:MAG: putative lipoprotein YiaD [Steroidobacteraceae bacterium]|nr:putative lipoprotein YiaD [Steroidobacteraceae bacterium]